MNSIEAAQVKWIKDNAPYLIMAGGGRSVQVLLHDTYTGAAGNAHNTTADSGQTRTTVRGQVNLDGDGQLIWADDGGSTDPSDVQYGAVAADITIHLRGVTIPVGSGIHIHFNSDATLENGWSVNMADANSLNIVMIVGGVQIIKASSSGSLTNGTNCFLTVVVRGDTITATGSDGDTTETVTYTVVNRGNKTQDIIGLSVGRDTKISDLSATI